MFSWFSMPHNACNVFWSMKTSKFLKQDIYKELDNLLGQSYYALLYYKYEHFTIKYTTRKIDGCSNNKDAYVNCYLSSSISLLVKWTSISQDSPKTVRIEDIDL